MEGSGNNILRIIRPFLRGWYIILACLIAGIVLGAINLYYSIPTYQTVATLQINDKNTGASTFLKSFESFSVTGQILTEVEVLRSKYLVGQAIEKMDVKVFYYRYVRGNRRNLYKKSPFRIEYTPSDSTHLDKQFHLFVEDETNFEITVGDENGKRIKGKIGNPVRVGSLILTVRKNQDWLKEHPDGWRPDHYSFSINSRQKLLGYFSNHNLVVVHPEKEVAIVKIFFTDEVPELAADMVNTLAETYIEDFIISKTQSASKALNFINDQVSEIESELRESERDLANYKTSTRVVDFALETDSKLKRIGELEVRKIGLELQKTELQNLLENVSRDSISGNLSLNYESVEDPTFTDAMIKINTLKATREELLQKYTAQHPEVVKIEKELDRSKDILTRSVENTLKTSQEKIDDVSRKIASANAEFAKLPNIERELLVLKRKFMTSEQVYAFLLEKKAEASIGAAATIAFHKVLERAPVPTASVSPKKALIMILAAIIGGIIGLLIVFMIQYLKALIYYPEDIEARLDVPVIGTIRKIPNDISHISQDFINLSTNIHLVRDTSLITVSGYSDREGKNHTALNLAKAMASIGYKTLLIDADLYQCTLHQDFGLSNEAGLVQVIRGETSLSASLQPTVIDNLDLLAGGTLSNEIPTSIVLNPAMWEMMDKLKNVYGRIIINAPRMKSVRDAIPLMKRSDLNLFSTWSGRSGYAEVGNSLKLIRKFSVPDVFAVMIMGESGKQASFEIYDGPLPGIGSGARRKLVRDTLRWIFMKQSPDGQKISVPGIGKGTRRGMISGTIRKILGRNG